MYSEQGWIRELPPCPTPKVNFVDHFYMHVASQMWNFAVLLPLMVGDKIPEDDTKWECFLLLVEITKICTARVTSIAAANYLSALIEQHHRLFKSCYPTVSLIPKTHYMVHFPRLLTQ